MTSIGTLGLVDFRSDEERTARYAKQTRDAARAQVAQEAKALKQTRNAVRAQVAQEEMALELQRKQLMALNHANTAAAMRPQTTPAGWYADPGNPDCIRWFDGAQWTDNVALAQRPTPPGMAT